MTRLLYLLAASFALCATSIRADFINFDPDGTNNPNGTGSLPATTISGFDQAVGNALGAQENSAIANFVAGGPPSGSQFDMYYQATLQGYSGGSPPPPTGINSNFQLTFSLRVREAVTSVTNLGNGGSIVTFAAVTPPGGSSDPNYFLRMYYNGSASTANTNGNLSGLTFQDGQVILDASPTIKPVDTGNFQTNGAGNAPAIDTFDKNGVNNYPGVNTVVGNGSMVLDFAVNAVDPTFFISTPSQIEFHLNSSLVVPFDTVDPSQQFRNKDSAASLGPTAPGTLVNPNRGSVNGAALSGGGGPDIQYQADANSSITIVPEPSALSLIGFGLAGLLCRACARRK